MVVSPGMQQPLAYHGQTWQVCFFLQYSQLLLIQFHENIMFLRFWFFFWLGYIIVYFSVNAVMNSVNYPLAQLVAKGI